jgi:starch synthase
VLPHYETKFVKENEFEAVYSGFVKLGIFNFPFTIQKEKTDILEFELYLVEIPELFDRNEIYGYEDDIERFIVFQIATLDWINSRNTLPDVVNCHDHHTGLIPFMMLYAYKFEKLRSVSTVITVHNSIYQGQFGFDKLYYLPEFDLARVTVLEWNNRINSLATGIKCSRSMSTVSPNFLNEINNFGYGLEHLFNQVRHKSKGILNGIDIEVWNPVKDKLLVANYSGRTFEKGKQTNKEELCNKFDLDPSKPLFSFIGRLVDEKGADLLPHIAAQALSENFKEINILILGSGNAAVEQQLSHLLASFKGNYNVYIGYNEAVAHLIYAGSDFLLMPSRVEACGLNQMYAFRYGTIPIVRRTGGLKDTVIDIGDDGNGICHDQPSIEDVCYSIQRAVSLYKDTKMFKSIRKKVMDIDHSWESACQEYIDLYNLKTN